MTEPSLLRPAIALLVDAGFSLVPQPMRVASVEFNFDAVLVHPDSLDLIVVEDTSIGDQLGLPAKAEGLARALDVIRSRRSLTFVLVGPRPSNPVVDRVSRVARVLLANEPGATGIAYTLAVLLPLSLEPATAEPANSWRALSEDLHEQVGGNEMASLLKAASRGSAAVTSALQRILSADFDVPDA